MSLSPLAKFALINAAEKVDQNQKDQELQRDLEEFNRTMVNAGVKFVINTRPFNSDHLSSLEKSD